MTIKRLTAMILLMVYLSLMHPMLGYSQESAESNIDQRLLPLGASTELERSTVKIDADNGGEVRLGFARVTIPSGALSEDTEITIERLHHTKETGESLVNVIPGGGAYRFLPAGTQFLKEVSIELPYDKKLNGKEGSLAELQTYYYDEQTARWEALERIGYDESRGIVESVTTHFTDMINGTLALPESADPIDVNLNSIKNLEAVNGSSGVPGLEGLEASSDGSAGFVLSVEIPAGRMGMKPQVSIRYNSGGGDGLSGKDFALAYGGEINIDTRHGTPKYDGNDQYTLDGVSLIKDDGREGYYSEERIRSYRSIRHIADENYWEVVESNGRKKVYGKRDDSWGGRDSDGKEKNIWKLESEEDVFGNTIIYEYEKHYGYVYPSAINYTGYKDARGNYEIRFVYEAGDREDIRIDARGRYMQELRRRLEKINVVSGVLGNSETVLRSYVFEYDEDKQGIAKESMVTSLVGKDANGETWWRYGFEYEEIGKDEKGNPLYFDDPILYGNVPLTVSNTVSNGSQYSAGGGVGFGGGGVDVRVTGGGQWSNTKSTTYRETILTDINGDGRVDVVSQSGDNLSVQLNNGNGFDDEVDFFVNGLSAIDIEKEIGKSNSSGWNIYAGATVISPLLSVGYGPSESEQEGSGELTSSFIDVNGDGLVDIAVSDANYYYKNISDGNRIQFESSPLRMNSLPVQKPKLSDTEKYHKTYVIQRPFRMWKSPYKGSIRIDQTVSKIGDGTVTASTYRGVERVAFIRGANTGQWENFVELPIEEHDRLYYIHDVTGAEGDERNIRGNDVDWNIKVKYTSMNPYTSLDDLIEYVPGSAMTTYGNYDKSLLYLYDPVYESDSDYNYNLVSYSLVSNWQQLLWDGSGKAADVRQELHKMGSYVPKKIKAERFHRLIENLGSRRSIMLMGLTDVQILGMYYVYDAVWKEYRKQSDTVVDKNILNAVWSVLSSYEDREDDKLRNTILNDYPLHGVVPKFADGGVSYVTNRNAAVSSERLRGKEGSVFDNGNYIELGRYDEEAVYIENNVFYIGGEATKYPVTINSIDLKNAEVTVQKIDAANNREASITWTLSGGIDKVQTLEPEEMDSIWLDGIFDELFVGVNSRVNYTFAGNNYWSDGKSDELHAFFDKHIEYGHITESAAAAFFATYYDEEEISCPINCEEICPADCKCGCKSEDGKIVAPHTCETYTKYVRKTNLLPEDTDTVQALFDRLEWEYFFDIAFPCYTETDELYVLKDEYKTSADTELELGQIESDRMKRERLLKAITNKYQLYAYTAVSTSIHYADYAYAVTTDENEGISTYKYLGFAESGTELETKQSEIKMWDSSQDYSNNDVTLIHPVYETVTITENGETYTDEELVIQSDDILYGGEHGWYYGIWVGDEYLNPFSETALRLQRTEGLRYAEGMEGKTEDDIKAEMEKKANAASEQTSSGGVEFGTDRKFYLVKNYDALLKEEIYETEMLTREGEVDAAYAGSFDITETLVGEISVVSHQTTKWLGTNRSIETVNTLYFPYIQKDRIHVNRNGGSAYYEIPGITAASNEGAGIGLLRESENGGTDKGSTAGIAISSRNKSHTTNWGAMTRNVQDMNGDSIPDLVIADKGIKVHYGRRGIADTVEYGDSITIDRSKSKLSRTDSDVSTTGVGFNAGPSITTVMDSTGEITGISIPGNPSFGGNNAHSDGTNTQSIGMLDINGDGLSDYLNGSTIELGTGYEYLASDMKSPGTVSQGVISSESRTLSGGLGIFDGIPRSTASLTLGLSVGGSKSSSLAHNTQMMMDINGDGLPDNVKKGEQGNIDVQFNTGNGFAQETVSIPMPKWGDEITNYLSAHYGNTSDGNLNPQSLQDAAVIGSAYKEQAYENHYGDSESIALWTNEIDSTSTVTQGMNGGLNVGGTVKIRLFLFVSINISAAANAGGNGNSGVTSASIKMMDINGDGFVDQVLRVPGSGTYAKLNKGAKVGLLKKIILPQGGSYTLEYASAGNTPQMPQHRNVLSSVTISDDLETESGGVSQYTKRYEYHNGYYDRLAKEFYGFETVITRYGTEKDGNGGESRRETRYYNRNYYTKGMNMSDSVYDENGNLIQENYQTADNAPYARIMQSESSVYDADDRSKSIHGRQRYVYDEYGNVTTLYDDGNILNADDDLEAQFSYFINSFVHIYSFPESITVKDSDGTTLRYRKGIYEPETGSLIELREHWNTSDYLSYKYSYDEYGNTLSVSDSVGVRLDYTYDDVLHQYLMKIEQSANGSEDSYASFMEWDTVCSRKLREIDPNGSQISYAYDEKGRLIEVRTSYDSRGTPAVKYEYYIEDNARWYTVTENKITFDGDDEQVMRTIAELDGLGRIRRTAKSGEVYETNLGRSLQGWNISGTVKYDYKGRAVEEGQTYFHDAADVASLLQSERQFERITRKEYDGLDRVIRTVLPGTGIENNEVAIKNNYGVANFNNQCYTYTQTVDPLENMSLQYQDIRGNIVRVERKNKTQELLTNAEYTYNALGEMLEARDAQGNPIRVRYDQLGRKTSLESLDSGREEYEYNDEGQLWSVTDSVMKKKGQHIMYEYDTFGRMTRINYPESSDILYEYGSPDDTDKNQAGRVVKITDESGSVEYEYGELGETILERRVIASAITSSTSLKTAEMAYRSDYLGRMQWIQYPDGEKVRYGYNYGGEVESVIGEKEGKLFPYVEQVGYDEWGQRVFMKLGNGVETAYEYDENRRWLDSINTTNGSSVLQNIKYRFDDVGNVSGYTNVSGNYTTNQTYGYDGLYQLISADGYTEQYGDYQAEYHQTFQFDGGGLGRMEQKVSSTEKSDSRIIGDNLDYTLDYEYEEGYVYRATRIGTRYYEYDENGNVTLEQEGAIPENDTGITYTVTDLGNDRYMADYGWALDHDGGKVVEDTGGFRRTYNWNERKLLRETNDSRYNVKYSYGHDGERTGKYSTSVSGGSEGETLYFNKMWSWRYDGSQIDRVGQNSKHIYLGDTRIITKILRADGSFTNEETMKQYYYHSDHLGSAQLITNHEGDEYERLEYTPYGEVWVEKASTATNIDIPYRFTGKERDEETGLYYYGARYLDAKTSRWMSTDPALSSYLPTAGSDNSSLPGMGGIYNYVNANLYHYGGNNPMKYNDPTGMIIKDAASTLMSDAGDAILGDPETSSEYISDVGCVLTAYTRIASAITGNEISLETANAKAAELGLFNDNNELTSEGGATLINALVGDPNISVSFEGSITSDNLGGYQGALLDLEFDTNENYLTGRITTTNSAGTDTYGHTLNINSGSVEMDPHQIPNIDFNDTSGVRQQLNEDVRSNTLDRIDVFRVTRTETDL